MLKFIPNVNSENWTYNKYVKFRSLMILIKRDFCFIEKCLWRWRALKVCSHSGGREWELVRKRHIIYTVSWDAVSVMVTTPFVSSVLNHPPSSFFSSGSHMKKHEIKHRYSRGRVFCSLCACKENIYTILSITALPVTQKIK